MAEDLYADLRRQMISEIVAEATETASHTGRPHFDARIVEVMANVPRHEFVPVELQAYAYLNRPLPIGYEKTISQPYIVALMTDLLEPREDEIVLEIGAGAGYQAAILAELVRCVYTVDIIGQLATAAQRRLQRLGYDNVKVRTGNGYYGWPDHAPFDKIVVTAACELIPPLLLAQLKPGGRMVIPTGIPEHQVLTLVEKSASAGIATRDILPVRFSEIEEPDDCAGAA